MNHIFLSGTVETNPILLSKDKQKPHACMHLVVSHRNSTGFEKREVFPIHAWHNVALSLMEAVKASARVSVKGYLCQQRMDDCLQIYITAEEFHVSLRRPSRPKRRTEENTVTNKEAEKEALYEKTLSNHPFSTIDSNDVDIHEID